MGTNDPGIAQPLVLKHETFKIPTAISKNLIDALYIMSAAGYILTALLAYWSQFSEVALFIKTPLTENLTMEHSDYKMAP